MFVCACLQTRSCLIQQTQSKYRHRKWKVLGGWSWSAIPWTCRDKFLNPGTISEQQSSATVLMKKYKEGQKDLENARERKCMRIARHLGSGKTGSWWGWDYIRAVSPSSFAGDGEVDRWGQTEVSMSAIVGICTESREPAGEPPQRWRYVLKTRGMNAGFSSWMGRTFAEEGRCRQEAKRKTRVKIDECRGRHAEGWCDRMRRQQFVFKIQSQSINQILISESNKNNFKWSVFLCTSLNDWKQLIFPLIFSLSASQKETHNFLLAWLFTENIWSVAESWTSPHNHLFLTQ